MGKRLYHGNLKETCVKEQEIGQLLSGDPLARYELPRTDEYEEQFRIWLEACGFDSYGNWYETRLIPFIDKNNRFNNGTFAVFPYYWGDDEALQSMPNFVYKPEDVRICWYKYPLREAYANKPLTEQALIGILDVCGKSLKQLYK